MNSNEEDLYPCVGICQNDPETGICLGCGRPPAVPFTPTSAQETQSGGSGVQAVPAASKNK